MRLSMNILSDWLTKYQPETSIKTGNRIIRNVRLFSGEHTISPYNVYVSTTAVKNGNGVICMHQNDCLYLNTADGDQVINDVMDAFDYYNAVTDDIKEHLGEYSLQDLITKAEELMQGFLIIADSTYFVLAYGNVPSGLEDNVALKSVIANNIMDIKYIMSIEKNKEIREYHRKTYILRSDLIPVLSSVRNLFIEKQHIGWLIFTGDDISAGMMDIQDEIGDIIERWFRIHSDYNNRLERNSVFYDILSGQKLDIHKVQASLILLNCSEHYEKKVYAVKLPENISAYALCKKADSLLPPYSHAIVYNSQLVGIYSGPLEKINEYESGLAALLYGAGAVCGSSPSFKNVFNLPHQLEVANIVLLFCSENQEENPIVQFAEVSLLYAEKILKEQVGELLIHPAISCLLDYDKENQTDFLDTLMVYLECERNYADTARALFIHRNSLLYRIQRIQALTGLDLDDPSIRLHLILSLKML